MIKIKKRRSFFTIKKALPLFLKFYPHKTKKELIAGLKILLNQYQYTLLIAYKDKEPIGIAGITFGYLLYSEKFLRISNLYVLPEQRKSGVATLLINEASFIAKKHKCQQVILESYVTNLESHKTYFRENFTIDAFHFVKKL